MRGGLLLAALLLAGCGESETREGALTSDEDRQLNDAAAMLDEPEEDDDERNAENRDEEN